MIPEALKQHVSNRGVPPDSFLNELIASAKTIPIEVFEPNKNLDIFSYVLNTLGPWASVYHRRAVAFEVARVHAGLESAWNFGEGVDRTNKTSMANKTGQETGIFQVSYDSEMLGHAAMKPFAVAHGIENVDDFITKMKSDHKLALEYYFRLIRVNVQWAGPIIRHEINPWLRRDAVAEFQRLTAVA
jgi:hypothetical protein